jgi:hypothetical protein
VNRLVGVCACVLAGLLLLPLSVSAADQPFRTVIDSVVPKTPGLTIEGSMGGCDLMLQNQTGQDVVLFDQGNPPKPFRFATQPKGPSARPPIPVHLTGAWPCASLPPVTEDQRWNHVEATVGSWTLRGTVGALTFKLNGRTLYDPALDPSAEITFYLKIGAAVLMVGALLWAGPYLFRRRREILGTEKAA